MITANSWFKLAWRAWLKGKIIPQARKMELTIPIDCGEIDEPPVAHIARGAWLVRCPDPDCRGVEYAWEEGKFFCLSCYNGKWGHRIIPSVFPQDRKEIEELLKVRPLLNRNWYHDETLDDLKRQNKEHRDELLVPIDSSEGG